jgi:hypothetical protein
MTLNKWGVEYIPQTSILRPRQRSPLRVCASSFGLDVVKVTPLASYRIASLGQEVLGERTITFFFGVLEESQKSQLDLGMARVAVDLSHPRAKDRA